MDIGCECICACYDYDYPSNYKERNVKARKEHTCCECGETIKVGEVYQCATGIWSDEWRTYRTCMTCTHIRKDMCCNQFIFGTLRDDIVEFYGVDYVTGETFGVDD